MTLPATAQLSTGTSSNQGLLVIPSLSINAPIVKSSLGDVTWDISHLEMSVAHLEGTGWLDKPGNIVLAGHMENASGEPELFSRLDALKPGDEIYVRREGDERKFAVTQVKRVPSTDVSIVAETNDERLTLLACALDSYNEAEGDYTEHQVVIAEPAKDPAMEW
jgi:LPXTG-site transpeptidase (sortase) family protein